MNTPYLLARFKVLLAPEKHASGAGYQLVQTGRAIREAGPWGQGFSSSLEALVRLAASDGTGGPVRRAIRLEPSHGPRPGTHRGSRDALCQFRFPVSPANGGGGSRPERLSPKRPSPPISCLTVLAQWRYIKEQIAPKAKTGNSTELIRQKRSGSWAERPGCQKDPEPSPEPPVMNRSGNPAVTRGGYNHRGWREYNHLGWRTYQRGSVLSQARFERPAGRSRQVVPRKPTFRPE